MYVPQGAQDQLRYVDQNRVGDHICDISNLRRLRATYQGWELTRSLDDILPQASGAAGGTRYGPTTPACRLSICDARVVSIRSAVDHAWEWLVAGCS